MSAVRISAPRSLLFVPASRPDMIAKTPRWQPDIVVVDLEDAVAATAKDSARVRGIEGAAAIAEQVTVLVRVNPRGSRWFEDDLVAVAGSGVRGVVLPKYESVDDALAVREVLPDTSALLVGLETARGVAACEELLGDADVDAAYFGAEDYAVDVGGRRTAAGTEVLYARSRVLLAARLGHVGAVDQAVVDIGDDDRFVADAEAGSAIGYTGKICVHPRQVRLAHEAFAPSQVDVEHARAVLQMAERSGVGLVDGKMTDEVHVRWARLVLERAERGTEDR